MKDRSETKILVVDDDGPILAALKLRLEHAGYTVMVARDSSSACVQAKRSMPDIALLDINMPGGDGFELAKTLDRLAEKRIEKVFITASKKPGLRDKAYECGATDLIEKPFSSDRLFDTLISIDDRRAERDGSYA